MSKRKPKIDRAEKPKNADKCNCEKPTLTRTTDENYNPICAKCGRKI